MEEIDVAKRLMDYGFHAPTVSFPVPGTLMIEPTESEPKEELDRFCDAMIAIRGEIQAVVDGQGRREGQRAEERAAHRGRWCRTTSGRTRTRAGRRRFRCRSSARTSSGRASARIDNPYGDRNLFCVCPPAEAYAEAAYRDSERNVGASRLKQLGAI